MTHDPASRLPDWPRRMGIELAAAYMGVSPSTFAARVQSGAYPPAIADGKRRLWDRVVLDRHVDRESGIAQSGGQLSEEQRMLEALRGRSAA